MDVSYGNICYGHPSVKGNSSIASVFLAAKNDEKNSSYNALFEMEREKRCIGYLEEIPLHYSYDELFKNLSSYTEVSEKDLCLSFHYLQVENTTGTQLDHSSLCQIVNGRLLNSYERFHLFKDFFEDPSELSYSCNFSQPMLTSRSSITQPIYLSSEKADPPHTSRVTHWNSWTTRSFVVSLRYHFTCYACLIPKHQTFMVYGNIDVRNDHRHVYIYNETCIRGVDMEIIRGLNNVWTMTLFRNSYFRLIIKKPHFPIGRFYWYYGHNQKLISITVCNDKQFACSNGHCAPIESRCNGTRECIDGSDEVKCKLLVKPDGYLRNQVPPASSLSYEIVINAMQDISISEGVATFDMSVSFYWVDSRLSLRNPQLDSVLNCADIWNPEVVVKDGCVGGFKVEPVVLETCSPNYNDFNYSSYDTMTPYADRILSNPKLKLEVEALFSLPCHFDLSKYPFGSLTCSVCIDSKSPVKPYRENRIIRYEGKEDLGELHLVQIIDESKSINQINIVLHFNSIYTFHVINTFIPSGLICGMCYITMFFHVKEFNERIMVSLTSVLVLAALFSQLAETSVRTSYAKLIELWYVCLMAYCFLIVIYHSVLQKVSRKIVSCNLNKTKKNKFMVHLVWVNRFFRIFFISLFVALCVSFAAFS